MRFYMPYTQFYCGVDLHARSMYICVIDRDNNILVHQNVRNQATAEFLKLIGEYDAVIRELEVYILEHTRQYWRRELNIVQSIRGIGDIIALTILYEMENIERFSTVGEFVSYCRLVRCTHESAGKKYLGSNKKIGNPYLKRVFGEAAVFVVKFNPNIQKYFNKLVNKRRSSIGI